MTEAVDSSNVNELLDHSYAHIDVDKLPAPSVPVSQGIHHAVQHTKLENLFDSHHVVSVSTKAPSYINGSAHNRNVDEKHGNIKNDGYQGMGYQLQDNSAIVRAAPVGAVGQLMSSGAHTKELPSQSGAIITPYPQWTNCDSLCWLDLATCLLIHCYSLYQLTNS